MPVSSTSTTFVPSSTSTPILCSWRSAFVDRWSPNVGQHRVERVDQDDPRLLRVDVAELARRRCRCASSAIWPAISTPVGPAPTTTNVSHRSTAAGSVSSSASSNAPKIRPRSSSASSMLFMPGANSANPSLPKYDCDAPAATISESYATV